MANLRPYPFQRGHSAPQLPQRDLRDHVPIGTWVCKLLDLPLATTSLRPRNHITRCESKYVMNVTRDAVLYLWKSVCYPLANGAKQWPSRTSGTYKSAEQNCESSHESNSCRIWGVLHWKWRPVFPCLSSQITVPVARTVNPLGSARSTSRVSANLNDLGLRIAIPLLLTFMVEHSIDAGVPVTAAIRTGRLTVTRKYLRRSLRIRSYAAYKVCRTVRVSIGRRSKKCARSLIARVASPTSVATAKTIAFLFEQLSRTRASTGRASAIVSKSRSTPSYFARLSCSDISRESIVHCASIPSSLDKSVNVVTRPWSALRSSICNVVTGTPRTLMFAFTTIAIGRPLRSVMQLLKGRCLMDQQTVFERVTPLLQLSVDCRLTDAKGAGGFDHIAAKKADRACDFALFNRLEGQYLLILTNTRMPRGHHSRDVF